MRTIELTDEERDLLRELLRQNRSEMEVEIFHTDSHDFKEILKRRRDALDHVLAKLAATLQPA